MAEDVNKDILETDFCKLGARRWEGLKTVDCLEGGVQTKAKNYF